MDWLTPILSKVDNLAVLVLMLCLMGPWWNHKDATPARVANAERLLAACEGLESLAKANGGGSFVCVLGEIK